MPGVTLSLPTYTDRYTITPTLIYCTSPEQRASQRDTAYPILPTFLALDGSNHCRLRLRAAFWTPSKWESGNGENPGVLA